jgi:hypothetical protein
MTNFYLLEVSLNPKILRFAGLYKIQNTVLEIIKIFIVQQFI